MELRHLRHFVALANELSFNKAAQKLNMAQPPLSQSIRRLEESLGVQLFERSSRGVALTRGGRAFLADARLALRHSELARKLAIREAESVPVVRLSFVPTAMYRLLPDLLRKFGESTPNVRIQLFEGPSPSQVEPLLSGDRDVAFVGNATKGIDAFETLIVERSTLAAVVPAHWPLADRSHISLSELADYPFILPPPIHATEGHEMLSWFHNAGVVPHVTQEVAHVSTTLRLVAAGLGCTITTSTASFAHPPTVRFIPLSDDSFSAKHEIWMTWLPNRLTEASRNFVRFAADYVRENLLD